MSVVEASVLVAVSSAFYNIEERRASSATCLSGLAMALLSKSVMGNEATPPPSPEELAEENKRTRRLQIVISLVMNVISQGELPYAEAVELVASTRRIALQLFPGKETAFDLIYQPRLKRLLNEVYRIQ